MARVAGLAVGIALGLVTGAVAGFIAGRRGVARTTPSSGSRTEESAERVADRPAVGLGAAAPQRTAEPRVDPAASSSATAAPASGDPASAAPTVPPNAPAATADPAGELSAPSPLRDQLLAASVGDRQRLLGEALAKLNALPPDERAKELGELFGAHGWFDESMGPSLDRPLWDLATRTLLELDDPARRSELFETLGKQLARARGVDPMVEMLTTLKTTLDVERARLDQRPTAPADPALDSLRRLLEAEGKVAPGDAPFDEDLLARSLFAFAGESATRDDRRLLMRFAEGHASASVRSASLLALATTPDDPATDAFLAAHANDAGRVWIERLMAWQSLRRRGREELLSPAVRREILDAWSASGVTELENAFSK